MSALSTSRVAGLVFVVPFLAACSAATVDMSEPRRLVGTESSVRIDAEIGSDELGPGTAVPLTCQITNGRDRTIAVADILPHVSYDPETRVITVSLGSEVPGESTLPRLIAVAPGETKAISVSVRTALGVQAQASNPARTHPAAIRVKVNFLNDTTAFGDLIAMQQKAVVDPGRADQVFPLWIEKNEAVYTNAVPIRWTSRREGMDDASTSSSGARPRRRW